jgi:predicted nucleotidyltransferase
VPELDEYLAELVRRTDEALKDNLLAIYLHGSSAMGAFVPSRSDIDVLTVTEGALDSAARARSPRPSRNGTSRVPVSDWSCRS